MKPRFLKQCPACGTLDCTKDYDFPDTMEHCNQCGSGWNSNGEVTLDARSKLTERQILAKGWFVDVKY